MVVRSLPVRVVSCTFVFFSLAVVAFAGATPSQPSSELQSPKEPLLQLVDDAVDRTTRRYLEATQHTPWQIMHGLLALRKEYVIKHNGQPVNALEWISNGATWQREYWFEATPYGAKAHPYSVTYWFEGHVNQFLAITSMCNLPLDHEFRVKDGKVVTMADMVRHAQMNTNSREETTWTLWFLSNYLDQDTQWTTYDNQAWSMERLVRINNQAQVTTAPCGGTHQLFALSLARNSYMQKHGRLNGAWLEADQKLQSYIAAAKAGQNPDGTFSSAMFKGRGYSNDFNERIKTSGHMLEWLMAALPERRLSEPWVRSGVEAVARDLTTNANQPADCGPLYHALHSVILYRDRVAPKSTPSSQPATELAKSDPPVGPKPVEKSPDPEVKPEVKVIDVQKPEPKPAESTPAVKDKVETIEETLLPPPPPMREPSEPEPPPFGSDIDEARPRNAPVDQLIELDLPPLPPR
jgi:hypothetical protein